MSFSFLCFGHKNTLSAHKTTIEFTKDKELTLRGDCILGVNAEEIPPAFDGMIKVTLEVGDLKDSFTCEANPDFSSKSEMVIRKSEFLDARTFAINSSKAAIDIDRRLVETMKNEKTKMRVTIEKI